MHIPSYLSLSRHNIYYYRYPIPTSLHPEGKQRHIRLSLHTSNERQAMYTAHRLSYHAERLTSALQDTCMEYDEIRATIKDALTKLVNDTKAARLESGPLDSNRRKSLEHWLDQYNQYDTEDFYSGDIVVTNADRKLKELVPEIKAQSDSRDELVKEFIRQYPEALKSILDHNDNPEDIDFDKEPGSSLLLTEAITRHTEEQLRTDSWVPNTRREKRTHFVLLTGILGDGCKASVLTWQKAEEIKNILLKLPQNRNKDKRTRELPLQEALEVKGPEKLASATVNKYLDSYSGLCMWLKNHGHISENPFAGMKLKDKKEAKRDAFTVPQIKTILTALKAPKIRDSRKQFRYWGPMIAAYTGVRVSAVSQLYVDDIKNKDGIWFFHFNQSREDQNLKGTCERKIPIHSAILDAKFLDYIERLKKQKQNRVFPQLTYDKRGKSGYGRNLSHWFNQVFLEDLGLKTSTLVFHSLRHTVATELYEAGVSDYITKKILGHKHGDVTNTFYNKSENLKQMQEALEKLPY